MDAWKHIYISQIHSKDHALITFHCFVCQKSCVCIELDVKERVPAFDKLQGHLNSTPA